MLQIDNIKDYGHGIYHESDDKCQVFANEIKLNQAFTKDNVLVSLPGRLRWQLVPSLDTKVYSRYE